MLRSLRHSPVADMLGAPRVAGGHTKGVFAADGKSGFYLIHSVPKFPDLRQPSFTWNASTTCVRLRGSPAGLPC